MSYYLFLPWIKLYDHVLYVPLHYSKKQYIYIIICTKSHNIILFWLRNNAEIKFQMKTPLIFCHKTEKCSKPSIVTTFSWLKNTFMHLADGFIQSNLQSIQAIHFIWCFISMCVPWELNPQPFALLMQCSTTEPQEHQQLTERLWQLGNNLWSSLEHLICDA